MLFNKIMKTCINQHAFISFYQTTSILNAFQIKRMHLFIENSWNHIHKTDDIKYRELIYILKNAGVTHIVLAQE